MTTSLTILMLFILSQETIIVKKWVKLSTMFKDAVYVPHAITHDIARKLIRIYYQFNDETIANGLSHHPGNTNLQKIAKDRNTPKPLMALARSS